MKARQRAQRQRKKQRSLWFEKLMAVVAIADVGLVLFDLTYIPLRDFYYRHVPVVQGWYDDIKGIEPYRDTAQYIELVDQLEAQVAETGIQSPQVAPILDELRDRSEAIIDENPFQLANKTGSLERIKKEIRDRMERDSAKDAFREFWTREYLRDTGWNNAIEFFDDEIRPKMATNYFRSISIRGSFTDRFWMLDIGFISIFGLEFIARTWTISRRVGIPWKEAWLLRWYDIFFLLPFSGLGIPILGLSRLIPLTFRFDQSELINLQPLRAQVNQGIVAALAGEITETVVIRVIDQLQATIEQDAVTNLVAQSQREYIDLNNINEVEALSQRFVQLSVYQVLPEIKPDLEALLLHSLTNGLKDTPLYTSVQAIPGMQDAPDRLARELVANITNTLYDVIRGAVEDPVGAKLFEQLSQHFVEALSREIGQPENADEIQDLLSDFLEEVKINYVRRSEIEDVEAIIQESRRLREAAQK